MTQAFDPRWTLFSADIELSSHCGQGCRMCPRDAFARSQGVMTPETFAVIGEKLASLRTRVSFCGIGNPLSNPHWPNFIRSYRDLGGTAGMVVHAAELSNEERERLVDVGPHFLEVSFASVEPAAFAELNPRADYQQSLQNVLDLAANPRRTFPLIMSGIQTGINPGEEEEYRRFWLQHGLQSRVSICHTRGGHLGDPELVPERDHGGTFRCGLFAIHAFVTWEGKLLACCHDLAGNTELGDLTADSLVDLMERKREALSLPGPFPVCMVCDDDLRHRHIPCRPFPETRSARRRFLRRWGRGLVD